MLVDFRTNVSLNPTPEQQMKLVANIHEITGTKWYTNRNLRDYFRGRRDTQAKLILRADGVSVQSIRLGGKEDSSPQNKGKRFLGDPAVQKLRACI